MQKILSVQNPLSEGRLNLSQENTNVISLQEAKFGLEITSATAKKFSLEITSAKTISRKIISKMQTEFLA